MATPTSAGWHRDDDGQERWFDGMQWTDHVRSVETETGSVHEAQEPPAVGWGAPPPISEPAEGPRPGYASYSSPSAYGSYGASPEATATGYGYMPQAETPLNQPLYGADMGQAIQRFFKRWNMFSGRSSRSEFWWVYLALFLTNMVLNFIPFLGAVVSLILALVTFIPLIALTIRRYHDTNKSGWWMLVPVIGQSAFMASVFLLVFGFIAGTGDYSSTYDETTGTYTTDSLSSAGDAFFAFAGISFLVGVVFGIWAIVQLAGASKPEGARFD